MKFVSVLCSIAFIALAIDASIWSLALAPIILAIFIAEAKRHSDTESEVHGLVKGFMHDYPSFNSARKCLIKASERSAKNKKMISRAAKASVLSADAMRLSLGNIGNDLRRFLAIALYGASTGTDISCSMSLFERRLKQERHSRLKFASKAKAMQFVSMAGLAFFFPMFSGISINIIAGYVPQASFLVLPLKVVSISYVLLMLLLSELFRDPNANAADLAYSVLSIGAVAASVLTLSSVYISNIV